MAGYGQRLRLRLFVEGVEVPVIAAQVQTAPNAPAACSIQIPPLAEGTQILPRSLVHLFFLDFYEAQAPFATTKNLRSPTEYEDVEGPGGDVLIPKSFVGDAHDTDLSRYKLLFGGEIIGFQWTKNQDSRSLVLQCQDWSNYWDYAYQWNNTDLFGPGYKAIFSGGATNLFTDFLEEEGSVILRIIQTPSVQYPKLKGLLGGIVHLLEAIGGCYYQDKKFAGQNIFFSIAELRLHITQMITAYEDDPTSSRLINAGYDSLLGRTLNGLGQQVSIRQAISALSGIIFHETYAQCAPCYFPSSTGDPGGRTRKSVRKDPNNAFIATTADGLLQSIDQVEAVLQLAIQQDFGSSADARFSVLASLAQMCTLCRQTVSKITDKTMAGARSFYSSALRSLSQAQAKLKAWKPGANKQIVKNITAPLEEARAQLQRAAEFEVVSGTTTVVPARLNQHIFRPDVWFSAPPRCNVIFPEHYHSLTYQREFLKEPTRLLLKTNDEFFGEDELFDQFYFAPKGFTLKKGQRDLQAILSNDILDHELFTGILPVFEKMGELNIFAARSGAVNGKQPKIGLAQRSANFLYFKYRFAARQLQIAGKFNPFLASGFPALVIDKYVNPAQLELRQQLIAQNGGVTTPDMNKLLGTHFLCNLTEVVHVVDQHQGMTQVNGTYARQPDESTEFLGVIRADQTVQRRLGSDAVRQTVVAAVFPPTIPALGPNQGEITAVEDVTQAYQAQDIKTGQKLPVYQGPTQAGTNNARVNVPIGLTLPASDYGQDVVSLIGSSDTLVRFRAYKVTETVPRYRQEVVDLPAEEYIRPGWYGDIWHPALIGKAYQKFFRTGAITDEQQVEIGDTASVGTPLELAEKALADAAKATSADDPRAISPGLLALDKNSSIQAAVAFLVQTYSYIKQQGLDVDEFIRSYTWRPVANIFDMFGSGDLVFSSDGKEVLQGVEGFHSRAFGPYDDLFGLVTNDIESVIGLQRGSTAAQKGDVRKRKQLAVQEYVAALQFARAILG